MKIAYVILISIPIPLLFQFLRLNETLHFLISTFLCIICSIITIFLFGLEKDERIFIIQKLNHKIHG